MSAAPVRSARPSRSEWLLLAVVGLAFAPSLLELATVWRGTDYLTHGFLVPVVAGFMAASRRDAWQALVPGRSIAGLATLVAGLGLASLGLLAGVATLTGLGVVVGVAGVVWGLRGAAAVRVMAFPIAFLLFMVPPPPSWIDPLILQLQLEVSVAAVAVLRLAGFAILRDGNVIVLPGGESLFVDEACSGITSVVTLVPLGVLLAFGTERTAARRAVLIACIVPAAMLGNLVRVTVTVWAASRVGVAAATSGFVHDWAGVLTYAGACGVLLLVAAGMRRFWPPEASR